MAVKLQFRRDTATNWETEDTILSEGELGLDTTNQRFKIGNGIDSWTEIDFAQYTEKAETFTATTTIVGSDGSSNWVEQTTGDWNGAYIATKTVTGIISTDTPLVELDLSTESFATFAILKAEFGGIFRAEVATNNEIKFYADFEPAADIPILIKVIR